MQGMRPGFYDGGEPERVRPRLGGGRVTADLDASFVPRPTCANDGDFRRRRAGAVRLLLSRLGTSLPMARDYESRDVAGLGLAV